MKTPTEKQQKLISYYETRLEKVKKHWLLNSKHVLKERAEEYIKFAENDLMQVKNGRQW